MATYTAAEVRRWLAQLGIDAQLPRARRALIINAPIAHGALGGCWRVVRVATRVYTIETLG